MVITRTGPDWIALEQRTDQLVDQVWGEPVEFHPWTGEGASNPGHADTSRPVIITQGCYVTAGAAAVGEISSGAAGAGAKQLEMSVWASIQAQYLGDYLTTWKADDRVYWPDRDEWFQIEYVAPSGTFRPNIHLLRLNDAALAQAQQRYKAIRLQDRPVVKIDPKPMRGVKPSIFLKGVVPRPQPPSDKDGKIVKSFRNGQRQKPKITRPFDRIAPPPKRITRR